MLCTYLITGKAGREKIWLRASWPRAKSNSVNKHVLLCFWILLTERTRVDQYSFLAELYSFFWPYHLKRTAFTRAFFSYDFPTKLRVGPNSSYD